MTPKNAKTEVPVEAAWCAPKTTSAEPTDTEDQNRVIWIAKAGGLSHPIVVTCCAKQILTMLEAPALNCTETNFESLAAVPN